MPVETAPAPVAPARTVTPEPVIPAPESPGKTSLETFDSHFDDVETETPQPATEPVPQTPPVSERPKDPTTGKFVPKVTPKEIAKEPVKEAPKTDEFTPPQVATGGQLRKFATEAGLRARQAHDELNKLRSELTKIKAEPKEDSTAIVAQLADAKKKLEEYEKEAQLTRYSTSSEYKDKYEKPYQSAVQQAYSDVKELLVSEPAPNEEDPNATKDRAATPSDFDEVYNLPLGPATRLAKQKFGDSSYIVLQHRTAIKNAAKSALQAIEEHKAKSTEYEQQKTAQTKLEEQGWQRMFDTAVEDIKSKNPTLFGEREGDSEWNESLSKGKAMADLAYGDRSTLTPVQEATLDAHAYNRLVAAPALFKENSKLKAENKRLTEELTQIRGSAPGKTTPVGKAPESTSKTWEEEFDKRVAKE